MKKIFICLASIICAFSCFMCFSACESSGKDGNDGKSAYEIWLDNGHSGTETDFLNWLKGDSGQGTDGKSAYEIWLDNGHTGTETDFLNWLKGDSGQGTDGKSAYEIWLDNGHTGTETDFLNWLRGEDGQVTVENCNHTFGSWTTVLESTCTQVGCSSRVCSKCGLVQYDFAGSHGHSWDGGVLVMQPNCIDQGLIIHTCETCGQTKSLVIDAFGHRFVNGKCSICGELESSESYLDYTLNSDGESYKVKLKPGLRNVVTFVNIPATYDGKSVTALEASAFASCTELKQVYLSEGLLSIGDYAFLNCRQLEEVIIPRSVVSMGSNPFLLDENIVVNVDNNPNFITVDGVLVDINSKTLISGLSATAIPSDGTVTIIGDNAFCKNNLTEIIIPETITSIGRNAFSVNKLTDVYYLGTEAEWNEIHIDENAFPINAIIHFNV